MSKIQNRTFDNSEAGLLDSRLFKFGTKLTLSLVVMILALTLMQCTVKKPESPTWETQFTIPLINRTYSMSEIIEKMDQDGISMDLDSAIIFSLSEDLDTVALDSDELTTGDLSYQAIQQLGLIDIVAPVIPPVTLPIMLIGGLAAYLPGIVPATSFTIVNDLGTIGTFTSVGITTGQAYVIVSNNLGFEIAADSVELWDLTYNRSIGVQTFGTPLSDGGTDSVLYDLSGQTISNRIEARIRASTPGGSVLSTSGKEITTTFRFSSNLTVGSATAEIPPLNRSVTEVVTLGESDAVYRATLTSGSLQMTIANQTNLDATLDITFPDLTFSGAPLNVQRTVTPISQTIVAIDLANYELTPIDSTVPQDIRVEVVVSIAGSAPQHVIVNQADQFMVDVSLTNLSFGSVTGVFSSVGSTISPSQHNLDLPDGFDSIQLVSAILTLSVENGVELPGNLDITLSGNNGKTVTISGAIAPATINNPVVTQFLDSTVADFLSPPPSVITVSGSAGFGDGINEGTIRAGDYIWASIDILAPLEMIIPETTIDTDVESKTIDQSDIDAITDHLLEARLVYNVINRMPLGARVNIFLSADSATVWTNPEVSFVNEIFILAAPTIGSVASDTVSTGYQSVVIDSTDINILKNDTLYIATQIILEDSNGQPVRLTAGDYITVLGRIEVDYRFDGEF